MSKRWGKWETEDKGRWGKWDDDSSDSPSPNVRRTSRSDDECGRWRTPFTDKPEPDEVREDLWNLWQRSQRMK